MIATAERESRGVRRILIVLAAGDAYPSGFIRGLIYKDLFREHGLAVRYVNRLFPPLIRLLDAPPQPLWRVMAAGLAALLYRLAGAVAFFKEVVIARIAKRYDVVYLSKVTSRRLVRKLRAATRARLVLDFGDALWLRGRSGEQFNAILTEVDAVTTDNEVTASHVRRFNPHCTVVPDCPQVEWFDRRRPGHRRADMVTLGWIGTPGTVHNLFVVWEALEHVFSRHDYLHLRLVGVGPDRRRLPPFERVTYSIRSRYSHSQMIDEVLSMDIGLFPLQDVEDSRVRGVLKAAVYMAGEAVAVCSPVGQCVDLIEDGINGFLAASTAEWESKLELLVTTPELRSRITRTALDRVRQEFALDQSFAKLHAVLTGTSRCLNAVLSP